MVVELEVEGEGREYEGVPWNKGALYPVKPGKNPTWYAELKSPEEMNPTAVEEVEEEPKREVELGEVEVYVPGRRTVEREEVELRRRGVSTFVPALYGYG